MLLFSTSGLAFKILHLSTSDPGFMQRSSLTEALELSYYMRKRDTYETTSANLRSSDDTIRLSIWVTRLLFPGHEPFEPLPVSSEQPAPV